MKRRQRDHVKERALQRFNLNLNRRARRAIQASILAGKGRAVFQDHRGYCHLVDFEGRMILAVTSRNSRELVTVMQFDTCTKPAVKDLKKVLGLLAGLQLIARRV